MMNNGYKVIKNFIPPSFANFLRTYFTVIAENGSCKEGDPQAPNSFCIYGDPAFDTVMVMSCPVVENALNKKLIPQYTYARIYLTDSVLERHTDRPECECSVTVSLGGQYDSLWPICIDDYNGNKNCIELDIGDATIYYGRDLHHWRDKFEGKTQYQLFLHYVDANGKYKDRKFDGRKNIGLP